MLSNIKFNFSAIIFLFENKRLWKYCLAPFLISLIVMVAIIYLLFIGFNNFPETVSANQEAVGVARVFQWVQSQLIGGIFKWVLFLILAVIILWYGFSMISNFLMFPFLEFLSNEVEKELRGKELNNPWFAGIIGSFLFSLGLLFLKLVLMVIGFVLSAMFPPFAIINFFIVAWFCGTESIDYCMSRNLYSVNKKVSFLFKQKFSLLSLGSFSAILLLVPILGIMQPIIAVVSGAMYFVNKTPELGINEKYAELLNAKAANQLA